MILGRLQSTLQHLQIEFEMDAQLIQQLKKANKTMVYVDSCPNHPFHLNVEYKKYCLEIEKLTRAVFHSSFSSASTESDIFDEQDPPHNCAITTGNITCLDYSSSDNGVNRLLLNNNNNSVFISSKNLAK